MPFVMSLLIYIIVLFFIGLYLSLSIPVSNSLFEFLYPNSILFLLISKHVYLSFYIIRITSLQGNHGYFFLCSCKQKQKQDKMKLENITIIFYSIMYYCPFFCYTTIHIYMLKASSHKLDL